MTPSCRRRGRRSTACLRARWHRHPQRCCDNARPSRGGGVDERADHRRRVERVTDRDVTHLFDKASGEFVVDRLLHEHTTRTGATLTVEAVDHEGDGVQCSVEIGVVEDDHRILAAKLEVHPLQRRRALCLDHRTGRRLADECDRLDQRVLGERTPADSPIPCTTFSTPGGRPASRDLRQELCGVRRPFGRHAPPCNRRQAPGRSSRCST